MKLSIKAVIKLCVKGILKVTDKALTGGVIHNYNETTRVSQNGTLDVNKLIRTIIGSTIPVILIISLLNGWITIEDLKTLIKLF
jgi:hypothetical protein